MQVKSAMTADVIGIQSGGAIAQAIDLMLRCRISGLPVFDASGSLVGILSEGDLLRRSELGTEQHRPRWIEFLLGPGKMANSYVHTHGRKVEEVMTREVVTTTEGASLSEAVDLMNRHRVKRLPVMFNGRVVGIITRADLLRILSGLLPASGQRAADDDLRQAILDQLDQQPWAPIASIDVEVKGGEVELRGTITDERQREALRVAAENVPGVKAIHDHLVWVEGNSGLYLLSPEDESAEKVERTAA